MEENANQPLFYSKQTEMTFTLNGVMFICTVEAVSEELARYIASDKEGNHTTFIRNGRDIQFWVYNQDGVKNALANLKELAGKYFQESYPVVGKIDEIVREFCSQYTLGRPL